ncbi:hypothetical protein CXF72_09015 [Psychromonas sp. MB-3u-54]|uniref:chalcone isomerase family protein n=1 Tax=Psychromonas sp. MB-3u-54 TaxID=2058319 RepID=UPI000C347F54|nr:chalcone isomerase family protein [Psychromonas sp. MB-3u-54]PKH02924.1 hypothetical protein CXF72_09015 [Psychromonas sp. MB-3u-54]
MTTLNKNTAKKRLTFALISVAFLLFSNLAYANVTAPLKTVGQGEMSWLFMDVYQVSLHSADGHYVHQEYPQALTIRYQRSFKKEWLIKATAEEWQKMKIDSRQYEPWLAQFFSLWPNVNSGDTLTFLVAKNGQGTFYHNDRLLGDINNRDLSRAFLDIWLSKKTSEPDLRRQLIGEIK